MKEKKYFKILIKIVNTCLFLILALIMVFCSNTKKEPASKETSKQIIKPAPEKPRLVHDESGNIIERHVKSYRKSDGSVRSEDSYYYQYDKRNNLIEETKKSHTIDGLLIYKIVNFYTYNKKDQKIEMQFYSYDKNDSINRQARTTFEYNNLGQLIIEQSYFKDGTIKGVIIHESNEKGDLISEEYIHYNPDGFKKDHKKYYYTEYGLDKTVDLMETK